MIPATAKRPALRFLLRLSLYTATGDLVFDREVTELAWSVKGLRERFPAERGYHVSDARVIA